MVETLAGIWLFLLSVGVGFIAGRFSRPHKKGGKTPTTLTEENFGWQELLNFLQYDGSGRMTTDRVERGGRKKE